MAKTIITNNLAQTQRVAGDLAKKIESTTVVDSGATVIGLVGDLGSGKTSFVQGFAKGLGIKEKITSPTFVIQKNYKLKTENYKLLIHIDAYRIKNSKEIFNLGWEEIISNSRNIIIIEWAEKIKKILPKKYIQINFEHLEGDKKKIMIKNAIIKR